MERARSENTGLTGVIINYYNPTSSEVLYYQTLLCVSSYLESGDCIVCVSDGSGFNNAKLAGELQLLDAVYVYSNHKLGFAGGYNQGINYFKGMPEIKYIILSANDIIASVNCVAELRRCFESSVQPGCVIPYLTYSDYFIQNVKYYYRTRLVPVMTLNCNFFLKDDLLNINMVPEDLSGYFNDIVIAARLFERGQRIYLAKGVVVSHLASRTVAISSTARYESDRAFFMKTYKDLTHKGGFYIKARKFSMQKKEIFLSFLIGLFPFIWCRNFFLSIYKSMFNLESFLYFNLPSLFPGSVKRSIKKLFVKNK